jgi:hypothetical protein
MAKVKKRRAHKRKEPATLKVTGVQLMTMGYAALEYLKDAAMLISIGETMGDFVDTNRGTQRNQPVDERELPSRATECRRHGVTIVHCDGDLLVLRTE